VKHVHAVVSSSVHKGVTSYVQSGNVHSVLEGISKIAKRYAEAHSTHFTCVLKGRAVAQAVSRRPLTAEARVRARVGLRGICGGQSGTGTGFSPSTSVFPCQLIPPVLH
jgi:hypothetical protein